MVYKFILLPEKGLLVHFPEFCSLKLREKKKTKTLQIYKSNKVYFYFQRMKWLPTPVFLPGESHGQRSLAGYNPGRIAKSQRSLAGYNPGRIAKSHTQLRG